MNNKGIECCDCEQNADLVVCFECDIVPCLYCDNHFALYHKHKHYSKHTQVKYDEYKSYLGNLQNNNNDSLDNVFLKYYDNKVVLNNIFNDNTEKYDIITFYSHVASGKSFLIKMLLTNTSQCDNLPHTSESQFYIDTKNINAYVNYQDRRIYVDTPGLYGICEPYQIYQDPKIYLEFLYYNSKMIIYPHYKILNSLKNNSEIVDVFKQLMNNVKSITESQRPILIIVINHLDNNVTDNLGEGVDLDINNFDILYTHDNYIKNNFMDLDNLKTLNSIFSDIYFVVINKFSHIDTIIGIKRIQRFKNFMHYLMTK